MPVRFSLRPRIVELLGEHESLTMVEIASELAISRESAVQAVRKMRKAKMVYVKDWTDDSEGTQNYLRPMYALGNERDKRKPNAAARHKQSKIRYDRKTRIARRAGLSKAPALQSGI